MIKRLGLLPLALAAGLTACPSGSNPQPTPPRNPPPPPPPAGSIGGEAAAGGGTQAAGGLARTLAPAADWSRPHVPSRVLVLGRAEQLLPQSAAGTRLTPLGSGLAAAAVPAGQTERAHAERVAAETGLAVQPDYLYRLQDSATPNDPRRGEQSYLERVGVPAAWGLETRGVMVAVIDTGVDAGHPDLAGELELGKDFCPRYDGGCQGEDDNPDDEDGHGTHTAGMIGAATNNGVGVAGIVQGGEKLLVVKAFGRDSQGAVATTASLASSIRHATARGAKVINLSLGIPPGPNGFSDPAVDEAIRLADEEDVVLVASSGNENGPLYYPASNPAVLAVGSVGAGDTVSSFSARGTGLDLVAPGEAALSTARGGGYERRTGTSEAAPQVAAAAALMRARNSNLTALQVKDILRGSAKKLGGSLCNETYGCGLLRTDEAVRRAKDAPTPTENTDRSIYVFADWYNPTESNPTYAACVSGGVSKGNGNCYDPLNSNSAVTNVVLDRGKFEVPFKIDQNRRGVGLSVGTYRLVACINANGNNIACDKGDLGGVGFPFPLEYAGGNISEVDIVLRAI